MDNAVASPHAASAAAQPLAPVALDAPLPTQARYWPTEQLSTFTLLMASHGRCVSAAMMLGDCDYALAQLSRAHALDDERLREVAVRLFNYFDDPHQGQVPLVLHS